MTQSLARGLLERLKAIAYRMPRPVRKALEFAWAVVTGKWSRQNSPIHSIVDRRWYSSRYGVSEARAARDFLDSSPTRDRVPNPSSERARASRSDSPDWVKRALNAPALSGHPLNQWIRLAYEPGARGSEIRNVREFVERGATWAEFFRAPFSQRDLDLVAQLEDLRQWLHAQAELSNELVSVVLCSRNSPGHLLDLAVASVLLQTHENFELVIIDNNDEPDPQVAEICSRDPRIRAVFTGPIGIGAARSFGIAQASGQYLAWMDDDNQWNPHFLRISLSEMNRRNLDAVYSAQAVWFGWDVQAQSGRRIQFIRYAPFSRNRLENHNFIDAMTMVCRIETARLVRPLTNSYEDWQLALEVSIYGRVGSIPVVLSHYNKNAKPESLTGIPYEKKKELRRKLREWQRDYYVTTEIDGFVMDEPLTQPPSEDVDFSRVAVVIPVYFAERELRRCLSALSRTPSAHLLQVILVDNTRSPEFLERLAHLITEFSLSITLTSTPEQGFSYAVNHGMRQITNRDTAVILNSDAYVTTSACAHLVKTLRDQPSCGMAVPAEIIGALHPTARVHSPGRFEDRPVDVTLSHHHRNVSIADPLRPEETLTLHFAPMFCAAVRVEDYWAVGGLNEHVSPHIASDVLFAEALTARLGKTIEYVPEAWVYHSVNVSSRAAREKGVSLQ